MSITVNLKKAYLLQQEIATIVDSIALSAQVSITEFQKAEDVVAQNRVLLKEKIVRKNTLIEARYTIRGLIDNANHSTSICTYLTELTSINKRMAVLDKLIQATPALQKTFREIQEKLDKIKRSESSYEDHVMAYILSSDDINELKEDLYELKRRKSYLSDQVAAANLTVEVHLPDNIEALLKEERII